MNDNHIDQDVVAPEETPAETPAPKAKKAGFTLDYELLDFGDGTKLERFGQNVVLRTDPEATRSRLHPHLWKTASCRIEPEGAAFKAMYKDTFVEPWVTTYTFDLNGKEHEIVFNLHSETSHHVGIFPEHAPQWSWIAHRVANRIATHGSCSVLNLFGYTGGASLAAAAAGAQVTHIDSAAGTLTDAKLNQQDSGMSALPIRWLRDDVMTFLKREIRRGSKYDAIIMDPPAFGRGPKGESFSLVKDLPELVALCHEVLMKRPCFLIFNQYPKNISVEACEELLREQFKNMQMSKQSLELVSSLDGRRIKCATALVLSPAKSTSSK